MLKILHCGDVHLDSPFSSLTPAGSEQKRRLLRDTFTDMMTYAAEQKMDMVLIAGDLFDSGYVYRDTLALLRSRFAALPCPVLIAPGNHDPYTPDSLYAQAAFPENVHVFSEERPTLIDFPALGVDVTGYAFTRDRYEGNPLAGLPTLPRDRIHLLLAHTELDAPLSRYAPIPRAALEHSGFAYAALGHVHTNTDALRAGTAVYAYCGMAEGRSFDEPGFGGANIVTIERQNDGLRVRVDRKVFSHHRYVTETLNVDGARCDDDVLLRLHTLIATRGYGAETALRVRLCGTVALAYTPDTARLTEAARGPLDCLNVLDFTSPLLDSDYLARDKSVRGEVYRILYNQLNSENEAERKKASLALQYALAALDGNLSV